MTQEFQVRNVDNVMTLAVTVRDQGKPVLSPPELNGVSAVYNVAIPDPVIVLEPWLTDPSKYVIELTITDELGITIYFGPRSYDVTGTAVLDIKHDLAPKDP